MLISALLIAELVTAQAMTEEQFRQVTEKIQSQVKLPNLADQPSLAKQPAKENKIDTTLAGLACRNKMRGMPCSISGGQEGRIPGICFSEKRNSPIYCRPSNHPAPREIRTEEKFEYRKPAPTPAPTQLPSLPTPPTGK